VKNIIVTGAGGAIGMATLPLLAADDVRLIAVDMSDQAIGRVRDLAGSLPGELVTIVSALDDFRTCVDLVASIGGPVAGLAHLAGLFEADPNGPRDAGVWDRAIANNLTNAYNMAGACMENLDRDAGPSFVFISSLAFSHGSWEHLSYAAAKGGLVGLVRALSRKLAPDCRVNGLAPGIIDSPMPAKLLADRGVNRVVAGIPLKRLGQPRDVAGAIAFLMGSDAAYITGQIINVDGGVANN
jgi:NAD(P)-dependent dehydrogenase (short-subunit alcohol dehydrogenase family)